MNWIATAIAWGLPISLFLFFREQSVVYVHLPPLPWNPKPEPLYLYWSFGAVLALPLVVIWLAFTAGMAWVLSREKRSNQEEVK